MVRAAIVGIGSWGRNLVSSVQGSSERIQFVAGATRTPEKARRWCDEQGIRLLDSYEALLRDEAIDAVVLATPHSLHCEQVVAAAKAGKHVLVEKPLGLDAREAAEAAKACAEHKVTLGVGYNWRFQPALRAAKAMLDDGTLGRLLHVEGNFCGPSAYRFSREHWRHDRGEVPAGGMTGRGVHVVDAMLYLAGHIGSVYAQSDRLVHDYGMDDTTSMLFRFRSGATAYLGTVIATAETWRMQVFGSKGWVEVGDVEHLHTWDLNTCLIDPADAHRKLRPELRRFPKTSTERAELEHFAEAAAARRPIALPDGDEVHNVAVLEAIVRSARDGNRVSVA
jgi:predicted dehydrogenase